mgnify:CR=1 FL=1
MNRGLFRIFLSILVLFGFYVSSYASVKTYKESGKVSDYYMSGIHGFYKKGDTIYVADNNHHQVIAFKLTGENVLKFGSQGTGTGQFKNPTDVTIDKDGNIWVVDYNNNRLQVFSSDGNFINTYGQYDNAASFRIYDPYITIKGPDGNYWISESYSSKSRILVISPNGKWVKTLGSKGSEDGQFYQPKGLAFDSDGNLWVVDSGNNRIQKFDSSGNFSSKFGSSGSSSGCCFKYVRSIYPLSDGLLIAYNKYLLKLTYSGVKAFKIDSFGSENSPFSSPNGVAVDSEGNIYLVDEGNNKVHKYTKDGDYIKSFGEKSSTFQAGKFYNPKDIQIDNTGNYLWITDYNHKVIQKFDKDGNYISHISLDSYPYGIFIDSSGNIWVSLYGGKVQKYSPEGNLLKTIENFTLNGTQYSLDSGVKDIAFDGTSLWVCDYDKDRILKINPNDLTAEEIKGFNNPHGIFLDGDTLWIADYDYYRIVQIDKSGNIKSCLLYTSPSPRD